MFAKLLVIAAFIGVVAGDACISCICKHESGCKPIGCRMDVGSLSCGYFQIKLPYYEDCGKVGMRSGESIDTAWKRCSDDYSCASTCVENYVKRYSGGCHQYSGCERTARLHNGGPNGCNVGGTLGYWNVVKACCGCS